MGTSARQRRRNDNDMITIGMLFSALILLISGLLRIIWKKLARPSYRIDDYSDDQLAAMYSRFREEDVALAETGIEEYAATLDDEEYEYASG